MSTRSKRSAAAAAVSIQEQGTPVKVAKLNNVTVESKGKQKAGEVLCACSYDTSDHYPLCLSSSAAESPPSVRSLLSSLTYGPAPESPAVAKAWLEDHGNSLGHFINGSWVRPEGRRTYDTYNPATGEKLASTVQGHLPTFSLCNFCYISPPNLHLCPNLTPSQTHITTCSAEHNV